MKRAFRRLLARNTALQQAVEASARARGANVEKVMSQALPR